MVEHLPLGQAFVAHGKAAGFVDASSDEFEVTETSLEAEVTIVLPSGASIRVTLVGEPSNFERIQAERVAEDGSVLESSSRFVQGSEVVLRDLEPGTWNVALAQGWGSDEVGAEQQVVVEPGVEAKLTIVRD
jgi:hypothetical protein